MNSTEKVFKDCREAHLSHCRKLVFAFLSLAIILLAVYSSSFDCSWQFDDEPNITDNPNLHLQEITWQGIKQSLFSDRNKPHSLYRPVACLSFALNHYFSGLDVFGYHLVNLIIHFLSSVFLFLFVFNTLNLPSLRKSYASNAYAISLVASVLWAINPIQTQAVTYIVQRMAALAAMFYILSMYFYLKARTASRPGSRAAFFLSCGLSFLLALGSKENAVMLPLSLFLYEAIVIQEDTGLFFRRNLKWLVLTLTIIALIGFIYLFFKDGNVFSFIKGYERRPFTMAERLLTQPRIFIFYISLLLYPMPNRLSIAHSFEVSTSFFEPVTTAFAILFIIALVGLSLGVAKRKPLISFCILFFIVNHIVESTIFPLELIYEHRNYLPSMLFFVPLSAGFLSLLDHFIDRKRMKYILCAFIVLLLVGLGHSTFMRNFTWKNQGSLWIDALEKAPGQLRVHHNLGRFYQNQGFNKQAVEEYKKALQAPMGHRRDEAIVTYHNLAKLYTDMGDLENGKRYYEQAIMMSPDFIPAYNNLAAILDRLGEKESAKALLLRVLKLNPYDGLANLNMGLFHLKRSEPHRAIEHLTRIRGAKSLEGEILLYLGIAYKQKGELGKASTYLRGAIDKRHRAADARLHLAEVYVRSNLEDKAEKEVEATIRLLARNSEGLTQIITRIAKNGELSHIEPSAEIVLPMISKALGKKSLEFKAWKDLVDKKLENRRDGKEP